MKVRDRWERWEALGAAALFVVFDDPDEIRSRMLRDLVPSSLPFAVLVDRERATYARWRLRRSSWWGIWMDPNVYVSYLRLLRRGERLTLGGSDSLQLGGDFVVDPQGILVYARPQRRDDRPPVAELLAAATEAASGGEG